jgi:hypothetical protein
MQLVRKLLSLIFNGLFYAIAIVIFTPIILLEIAMAIISLCIIAATTIILASLACVFAYEYPWIAAGMGVAAAATYLRFRIMNRAPDPAPPPSPTYDDLFPNFHHLNVAPRMRPINVPALNPQYREILISHFGGLAPPPPFPPLPQIFKNRLAAINYQDDLIEDFYDPITFELMENPINAVTEIQKPDRSFQEIEYIIDQSTYYRLKILPCGRREQPTNRQPILRCISCNSLKERINNEIMKLEHEYNTNHPSFQTATHRM